MTDKEFTLGIHCNEFTADNSFTHHWINYCEDKKINWIKVNCHSSSIHEDLKKCDALMWHHVHNDYLDEKIHSGLMMSLEASGKVVFPNFSSRWHFDNKIMQSYLFKSLEIQTPETFVSFDLIESLNWSRKAKYPQVFKLRKGAGSANVNIVKTANQAKKIIKKSFSSGFNPFDSIGYLERNFKKYQNNEISFLRMIKAAVRSFIGTGYSKKSNKIKNEVLFQDFIPNDGFDIRIIVIDGKAFGIKRVVPKDDFRASGGGNIIYDHNEIPIGAVKEAFRISTLLDADCMAYDFVVNQDELYLLEINYGFNPIKYIDCEGYWDANLIFNEVAFNPCGWMIDLVMKKLINEK